MYGEDKGRYGSIKVEVGERGTGSVWLVDRKDIEEEEEKEGVSYNTPRYLMVLYSNVCYSRLVQRTFIAKKSKTDIFLT